MIGLKGEHEMHASLSTSILTRMFLVTCNKDLSEYKSADYHEKYFIEVLGEMDKFCEVFPDGLQVIGKKVLDMGCGHGGSCIYFASHGAKEVVGMDVDTGYIDFARSKLREGYPGLLDRVKFMTNLDELREGTYDVIISKDTMEHVKSPDEYLRAAAALLRPGGRIYAGFAPLWNSPFGGHGRMRTRLPWGHVIFPEHVIINGLGKIYKDFQSRRIVDLGLNKLSFKELKQVLRRTGLRIIFFAPNVPTLSLKNKAITVLRKIPGLTEYLTHSVYFILEKN